MFVNFKNNLFFITTLLVCCGGCVRKNNLSEEGKIRAFFEELLFEHWQSKKVNLNSIHLLAYQRLRLVHKDLHAEGFPDIVYGAPF